jgi:transglutaminase-like putative cysteine protease
VQAQDADAACTAQRGPDATVDVELTVVVTPPYHAAKLQVWLPVPQTDSTQEVADYTVATWPIETQAQIGAEPLYGNTFAYLEFDHPEGAQIIRQTYRVTVRELRWQLREGAPAVDWPASFDPFLRSDASVNLGEELTKLAGQIVPEPTTPQADLAKIMDWVLANLSYDHAKCSLRASSEWAREHGCGHCSDYHGLAAALARSVGIPARVAYGVNLIPKNSPSHCKLEAYLPDAGWVSYDVSETQKQMDKVEGELGSEEHKATLIAAARRRLNAGFRDETWLRVTQGTDYELPFGGPRVPVVRTACVVADGELLPDPDPANKEKREFSWMTAHKYTPSRKLTNPFSGAGPLAEWAP